MDLGFRDLTTMGFFQERPDGLLMGHSWGDNLRPIGDYISYAKNFWRQRRLKPGNVWLPHDAKAKSLQTGKSIVQHFHPHGIRPRKVPELGLLDGIAATRSMFPVWYINEQENQDLILALMSYHRKYDEERKTYINEPVHDWSSHWCDMFRHASLVANLTDPRDHITQRARAMGIVTPAARSVNYGFSLNDIWGTGPRQSGRL
jgi:phage terminase large subunit